MKIRYTPLTLMITRHVYREKLLKTLILMTYFKVSEIDKFIHVVNNCQ